MSPAVTVSHAACSVLPAIFQLFAVALYWPRLSHTRWASVNPRNRQLSDEVSALDHRRGPRRSATTSPPTSRGSPPRSRARSSSASPGLTLLGVRSPAWRSSSRPRAASDSPCPALVWARRYDDTASVRFRPQAPTNGIHWTTLARPTTSLT